VLVTFLLGAGVAAAQIPADTVLSLRQGTMQTNGQGPVFFPQNVFRGPSTIGTETVPDADPREICSIGLGGSIVIGFRQAIIVDGPGPDLRIVENAFRYANGRIYAEPARVEVSRDARTWFAFPFDSASLRGCAGVTPLGDEFDLATIGVDSVRWIRITDVTSIVRDDPRHAFFDPTLTGFDLDVVLGLHLVPAAFELDVADVVLSTMIRIASPIPSTMSVFTMHGARVRVIALPAGRHDVDLADLPPGAYLVIVDDGRERRTLKVLR
jgi:hypothetical protein